MPTIVANFVSSISTKKTGDFSSKMWSSYTQLNPGVYSDAIATEFKRRMKPDYVENLMPNGGGLNATDWIDTNSDGLADGFTAINAPTATIETVLCPRGQRITRAGGSAFPFIQTASGTVSLGVSYTITIRWYSSMSSNGVNTGVRVLSSASVTSFYLTGAANQWNQQTLTYNLQDATYLSVGLVSTIVGDFLIVDFITVSPTISQNYYNTFGPPGLNKKTADWIYMLTTSGDLMSRSIAKSGVVMKWNLDGTIVTKNGLPTYTKGGNAGIITLTSIDGFGGVTSFDIFTNPFKGVCPTFVFANITRLAISTIPGYTGVLPSFNCPKLADFFVQDSRFSSVGSIAGFATNNASQFLLTNNTFNTANVNYVLACFNTMFAVTPPIKNLTLNLSGATMGIPTGAGSNTDLLGILAKFTAAGFTATIIVRTS